MFRSEKSIVTNHGSRCDNEKNSKFSIKLKLTKKYILEPFKDFGLSVLTIQTDSIVEQRAKELVLSATSRQWLTL